MKYLICFLLTFCLCGCWPFPNRSEREWLPVRFHKDYHVDIEEKININGYYVMEDDGYYYGVLPFILYKDGVYGNFLFGANEFHTSNFTYQLMELSEERV